MRNVGPMYKILLYEFQVIILHIFSEYHLVMVVHGHLFDMLRTKGLIVLYSFCIAM